MGLATQFTLGSATPEIGLGDPPFAPVGLCDAATRGADAWPPLSDGDAVATRDPAHALTARTTAVIRQNRHELAVILAAGHGTRMRARTPKVLHPICGRPMIDWVLEAVNEAGVKDVTVVANPHHADVAFEVGAGTSLTGR